jgi:hypothetical protein
VVGIGVAGWVQFVPVDYAISVEVDTFWVEVGYLVYCVLFACLVGVVWLSSWLYLLFFVCLQLVLMCFIRC